VKRFIFASTVKVNGEGDVFPYTEKDIPKPQDAYAISKREAEEALGRIAAETSLETVILRFPLVYGPGVKANFKNLIKIAVSGLPLPLKDISNRRSFVYLGNAVDAIKTCAVHPSAAGEIFMVSDGQDVSTPELIKMIALSLNKKPLMFSMPLGILKVFCRLLGKEEDMEKLTRSLIVDSKKIRDLLGWKPPFTLEEGIKGTVKHP
jgi:nucleoside-diphosphate-sugar epimerase